MNTIVFVFWKIVSITANLEKNWGTLAGVCYYWKSLSGHPNYYLPIQHFETDFVRLSHKLINLGEWNLNFPRDNSHHRISGRVPVSYEGKYMWSYDLYKSWLSYQLYGLPSMGSQSIRNHCASSRKFFFSRQWLSIIQISVNNEGSIFYTPWCVVDCREERGSRHAAFSGEL